MLTELEAFKRLHQIATRDVTIEGTQALYEEILDGALAILNADLGSIQMLYPERGAGGELKLIGHRGFSAEAALRWQWVSPATKTTCGEALRRRAPVAVTDVRDSAFMAGSEDLDGYLGAGIMAGQSLPLRSRSGAWLGMVSTYWREPHEMNATEARALDILARLAADIFEQAQAREDLRNLREEVTGVAHDFNNILSAVVAHAELAKEEVAAGLEAEDELDGVRKTALRGSEIVAQLMREAGRDTTVPLVNLSVVVERMIDLLKASVWPGTGLETVLGADVSLVQADEARLQQVVFNLVKNASDAIGEAGGSIRLTTTSTTGPLTDRKYVLLEVADTGCGMSPEVAAMALEPHFTTKGAGRGIGLALVDRIVRHLGGTIRIMSEAGKGTTVQVTVPGSTASAE